MIQVDVGDCILINARCEDVLPTIGTFSAIVTDPPYNLPAGAWENNYHGTNGKSRLWGERPEWEAIHPLVQSFPDMAASVIIWGGNNYELPLAECWFVWDKMQKSIRGADCELAWTKGCGFCHRVFRKSRIDAHVNDGEKKVHPNQKPLSLMEWCLDMAGVQGTVVDPFMGSGSTGEACVRAGLPFIGIEYDKNHFKVAVARLQKAVAEVDQGLFSRVGKPKKKKPKGLF